MPAYDVFSRIQYRPRLCGLGGIIFEELGIIVIRDEAQLLTYLKLTGIKLGLLINFHVPSLKDGIKRIAN